MGATAEIVLAFMAGVAFTLMIGTLVLLVAYNWFLRYTEKLQRSHHRLYIAMMIADQFNLPLFSVLDMDPEELGVVRKLLKHMNQPQESTLQ